MVISQLTHKTHYTYLFFFQINLKNYMGLGLGWTPISFYWTTRITPKNIWRVRLPLGCPGHLSFLFDVGPSFRMKTRRISCKLETSTIQKYLGIGESTINFQPWKYDKICCSRKRLATVKYPSLRSFGAWWIRTKMPIFWSMHVQNHSPIPSGKLT